MNTRPLIESSRTLRLKPLAACLALVLAGASVGAPSTAASAVAAPSANGAGTAHATSMLKGFGALQRSSGLARYMADRQAKAKAWAQAHVTPNRPASTVPVTSCLDDGSPGTLRSVMASAVSGDTVDLTGLTCSVITLVTQANSSVVLLATGDLTLVGPGADQLAIEGPGGVANTYAVDNVITGNGNLTIQGLTIRKGNSANGGCITNSANNSNISLIDSTVSDCIAGGKYALGGGVLNLAPGGTVTLTNSTVTNNHVTQTTYGELPPAGGGVVGYAGVTVTNSTISNNTVDSNTYFQSYGGAIMTGFGSPVTGPQGATVVIIGSTITGNTASHGGGVAVVKNTGGSSGYTGNFLHISNSTISGNTATTAGGGVWTAVPTMLHNSTVAFNTSSGEGGAGGVQVADTTDIQSSIISNNSNTSATATLDANLGVTATGAIAGDHNLIMSSNVTLPIGTLTTDPLLAPLASNGGATQTHALGAGSPAVDAGSNPDALPFDQRGTGFVRVIGSAADIGAFELPAPNDDTIFTDGFDGP